MDTSPIRHTIEAFQSDPFSGTEVVVGVVGEAVNAIYYGLGSTYLGNENIGDFVAFAIIFAPVIGQGAIRLVRERRQQQGHAA